MRYVDQRVQQNGRSESGGYHPKTGFYRRAAEYAEERFFYLAVRGRQIKRPSSCQHMRFLQPCGHKTLPVSVPEG